MKIGNALITEGEGAGTTQFKLLHKYDIGTMIGFSAVLSPEYVLYLFFVIEVMLFQASKQILS